METDTESSLLLCQKKWLIMSGRARRDQLRAYIQTIDQLRSFANQLEHFDGIGPITARVIRQELNRVAAPGEQIFDGGALSAWGA
jgi:hypothetical protein